MIRYVFEGWQERLVPIDEIEPHPDNPNSGDLDALVESIMVNGCFKPIGVSLRTKRILDGHHIYYAHLRYDMQYVPVDWIEATDDEHEIRMMLAANEVARRGRSDPDETLALLRRLRKNEEDEYAGLIGSGMDEYDYARLVRITHANRAPLKFDPEGVQPPRMWRAMRHVECPTCHHEFEIEEQP